MAWCEPLLLLLAISLWLLALRTLLSAAFDSKSAAELCSAWTAEGGCSYALLNNLADRSCAYRVSAFTDREAQAFFHRHRRDQFDHQADIVSRHHHLGAGW